MQARLSVPVFLELWLKQKRWDTYKRPDKVSVRDVYQSWAIWYQWFRFMSLKTAKVLEASTSCKKYNKNYHILSGHVFSGLHVAVIFTIRYIYISNKFLWGSGLRNLKKIWSYIVYSNYPTYKMFKIIYSKTFVSRKRYFNFKLQEKFKFNLQTDT